MKYFYNVWNKFWNNVWNKFKFTTFLDFMKQNKKIFTFLKISKWYKVLQMMKHVYTSRRTLLPRLLTNTINLMEMYNQKWLQIIVNAVARKFAGKGEENDSADCFFSSSLTDFTYRTLCIVHITTSHYYLTYALCVILLIKKMSLGWCFCLWILTNLWKAINAFKTSQIEWFSLIIAT